MFTIYANDGKREKIVKNVTESALPIYIESMKMLYSHVMVFAQ